MIYKFHNWYRNRTLFIVLIFLMASCAETRQNTSRSLEDLDTHLRLGNINPNLGEKIKCYLIEGGELDDLDWLYFLQSDSDRFENVKISDFIESRNKIVDVEYSEVYRILKKAGFFKGNQKFVNGTKKIQRKELVEFTADYALHDSDKILLKDLEADVWKGNDAYKEFVHQLIDISGGVFNPIDIKETWASEKGPVHISFLYNDSICSLKLDYYDDWMDSNIFEYIGEKTDNSEWGFYCFKADVQEAIIIFLRSTEVDILEEELDWQLIKM